MFFVVILVIALVAWAVVRLADPSDKLQTAGTFLTVFGAITTLLMWWLRVPVLIFAAGVALLIVGTRRARRATHRGSPSL